LQLYWEERTTNLKHFFCPGIGAETTVRFRTKKYGVEEGKSLLKRGWNIAAFLGERTIKFKHFTCPGIGAETTVRC
jgi:hypothetical protein